jgi:hypothetical protein
VSKQEITMSSKITAGVDEVLEDVRALLDAGEPEKALARISTHLRSRSGSKTLINAWGVCLMRMGRIDEAIKLFRGLVYHGDSFDI